VLGLAEFRTGRYERAVAHLGESLKVGTTWVAGPLNYPVLAMAHHQLGHGHEARLWLDQAHSRRSDSVRGVEASQAMSSTALW
jgi:hypothetical protein